MPGSLVGERITMPEIADFAMLVLVIAGGFSVAVLSTRLTERIPVPAPALFLAAAAVTSDLWPGLYDHVPIRTVERIAVVALVVILFNGGIDIGMRRLRASLVPVLSLGLRRHVPDRRRHRRRGALAARHGLDPRRPPSARR